MPTDHTITSYKYAELDDKAKEVARDWFRQHALDYDWWESTYEHAARVFIKISGFDLGRRQSVDAKFERSAIEVAKAIVAEHGKECDTFKHAQAFLAGAEAAPGVCRYSDCPNAASNTVVAEDDDDSRITCPRCRDDLGLDPIGSDEFMKDIKRDYWHLLNSEMEYRLSDEAIAEDIEANEYDFTADGRRFRY